MDKKIVLVIFLVFVCLVGCKNKNTEPKENTEQKVIVKDLNYHLANGLVEVENNIGVEQKFTNDVYLRSFAFYEKELNHYALILELQDDITEAVVSKYTFAVEGFVTVDELNNLSDYAKKKNRKYDAWFGTSKLTKVNNHCYVILDVKTKIKNFEQIKFYLFDRSGYKGDIGKRILFYDYTIK